MAQGLWDTIEATRKPHKQEDDEVAFHAWSKTDSMALHHVIHILCGNYAFS